MLCQSIHQICCIQLELMLLLVLCDHILNESRQISIHLWKLGSKDANRRFRHPTTREVGRGILIFHPRYMKSKRHLQNECVNQFRKIRLKNTCMPIKQNSESSN